MAKPDQDVRSRKSNPEARMELKEHLREFRDRLIKAAIATLIAAILSVIFLYQPFINAISQPLIEINEQQGRHATLNYSTIASPFDQLMRVGMYIGLVLASPVWLYQGLRYLLPALHAKEKKYLFGFLSGSLFAFACGVAISWWTLPGVVRALTMFTPSRAENIIAANDYIAFVVKFMFFFSLAFVIPVILVGINMLGLIRGKTVLKSWRWVVVLVAVIAAMTAPGTDIMMMFYLMAPLLAFFFIAIGICLINDKRRDRREAKLAKGMTEESIKTATSAEDLAAMGHVEKDEAKNQPAPLHTQPRITCTFSGASLHQFYHPGLYIRPGGYPVFGGWCTGRIEPCRITRTPVTPHSTRRLNNAPPTQKPPWRPSRKTWGSRWMIFSKAHAAV